MIEQIKAKLKDIDYSPVYNKKTAICIPAFNRPDYFKEVMDSISANPETSYLPVFFFLDGGPYSTKHENIDIIKSYENIKNKFVFSRQGNLGCSKNLIDARRTIFDMLDFDLTFVIEDDLVISENYIGLLLSAYNDLSKQYDNIGMMQGWNLDESANTPSPSIEKLSSFEVVENTHLWGYLMPQAAWDSIKNNLYQYEKTFHDPLPKNGMGKFVFESDLPAVRKFMASCWEDFPFETDNKRTIIDPYLKKKKERILGSDAATGQDINTELNLSSNGFVRLKTCQNRAKNIGKLGLHATDEIWERWGFGKVKLENFTEDKKIKKFKVV